MINMIKKLIVETIFKNFIKSAMWDKLDGKKTYIGLALYFAGVFIASTEYAQYAEMLITAGKMFGYNGAAHKADKYLKIIKAFLAELDKRKIDVPA